MCWEPCTTADAHCILQHHFTLMGSLSALHSPSQRQRCGLCRYFMQAIRLAMKDVQVRTGLAVVNHMLESPAALFQPLIAFKVFMLALQDALARLREKLQGGQVQRA